MSTDASEGFTDGEKREVIAMYLELAARFAAEAARFATQADLVRCEAFSRKALEALETARSLP